MSLLDDVAVFKAKLAAATKLTRADCRAEAKRIFDLAWKAAALVTKPPCKAAIGTPDAVDIPDALNAGQSKRIQGDKQTKRREALVHYLHAIPDSIRPHIAINFRPLAELTRTWTPEDGLVQRAVDAVNGFVNSADDLIAEMCSLYGFPQWSSAVPPEIRRVFLEEWNRLFWKAKLEAAPEQLIIPKGSLDDAIVGGSSEEAKSAGAVVALYIDTGAYEERKRRIIRECKGRSLAEYVEVLHDKRVATPLLWQRDGCPPDYLDACNHPDKKQREKWRKHIRDERYNDGRKKG